MRSQKFSNLIAHREKVIIEIGPGEEKRCPDAIGIDLHKKPSVDYIADLNQGLEFIEDNSVDEVHAYHVLEHILDDKQAMSELFRVLKPDGFAILQVPIALALEKTYEDYSIISKRGRERYFGQFDHVRIYGKDYPKRLESVGFHVEVSHPEKDHWDIPDLEKYALNKKESLYIAKKPF